MHFLQATKQVQGAPAPQEHLAHANERRPCPGSQKNPPGLLPRGEPLPGLGRNAGRKIPDLPKQPQPRRGGVGNPSEMPPTPQNSGGCSPLPRSLTARRAPSAGGRQQDTRTDRQTEPPHSQAAGRRPPSPTFWDPPKHVEHTSPPELLLRSGGPQFLDARHRSWLRGLGKGHLLGKNSPGAAS